MHGCLSYAWDPPTETMHPLRCPFFLYESLLFSLSLSLSRTLYLPVLHLPLPLASSRSSSFFCPFLRVLFFLFLLDSSIPPWCRCRRRARVRYLSRRIVITRNDFASGECVRACVHATAVRGRVCATVYVDTIYNYDPGLIGCVSFSLNVHDKAAVTHEVESRKNGARESKSPTRS